MDSEGVLLLIYGSLFGIPLIIAFIYFGMFMAQHNKELDERSAWYDSLAREREEKEKQE